MSDNIKLQTAYNKYYQTDSNYTAELSNKQRLIKNSDNIDISNDSLCTKLFEIQNLLKLDTKEIEPTTNDIEENIFEEDLSIVVDKLVNLYFEETNKGKKERVRKQFVLDYFNDYKISLQEIYNWLINNQTCSNSIYLLGYFNYYGIGIDINEKNAFNLYQKVAELEHMLAHFELANMYFCGKGVDKNYNKAFELSEKLSERKYSCGINRTGYCYEYGIGTHINEQKAFELFQKAADLGNIFGMYNLGRCYKNGFGTNVNKKKAFELFQKAAELGDVYGMNSLGRCYEKGIGINTNMQKAFELYQKAANFGYNGAQINLALMYECGNGTEKNMNQSIYWYKKSAEQGNKYAKNKLKQLLKD
jgi:TPR repeat protein